MSIKPELRWSLISAVIMIAGAWAILLPPETGEGLSTLVGSLLMLVAATGLGYAWRARDSGSHWSKRLLIGLGSTLIIAGGYVLLHPQMSFATMTYAFLTYLLGDSILQFLMAYQLRHSSASGWLRFEGISNSIIFGIVLLAVLTTWPAASRRVIGILVGMSMLFTGVARLLFSLAPSRERTAIHEEYHQME